MELFLYYLLRASVLMALFYGFYKLFLARSTFHNINRILLVFIALTVSLLPLFRFNLMPEKKPEPVTGTFPVDFSSIPITEFVEPQPQIEIPWIQILIILFIVGFLFALIRYLIGLNQIVTIIRKSERQTLADNVVLCVSDKDISPFSWMKYIVLSRKELLADNRAVIRHEKAHIHLQHSWDMVFFDLFSCLFWFNPFSWLLRREIQSVHEYQADEQVLLSGIDTKQYQLLLIRKSVGEYKFSLANNFRQRDLHKRITMMMKNKTNRRMKWNYAMGLPVLFLAMIALSVPKLNAKAMEKENNKADLVSEEITVSGQVVDEVSDDQSKIMVSGFVKDNQGVIAGALVIIKGTNRGTVTDMQGQFMIKTDIGSTLLFSMIDYKTGEYKVENAEKNNLVVVLEPDDAVKAVGERTMEAPQSDVKIVGGGPIDSLKGDVKKTTIRFGSKDAKPPLYILDGTPISDTEMQKIKPDDIESISVLKEKSAIQIYGVDGKDGVVLITTKKSNKDVITIGSGSMDSLRGDVKKVIVRTTETDSQDLNQLKENPPLIIVDGEKMPKDFELNSIDVYDIESISVLKDENATAIYGDEGKNGVIIITKKIPLLIQNP